MYDTQDSRIINITTPLGKDILIFASMSGDEALGRLFQFNLELVSRDNEIKIEDLLGKNLTVEMSLPEEGSRFFNGIVSHFSLVGELDGWFRYQATLRPWFWLLDQTVTCRVFQNKSVPEIIKEIFQEKVFFDFSESLIGTYTTWDYCVQYRETDFTFISRLMEEEGIYYYFSHEAGRHVLHLSDSIHAHQSISTPTVPYYPPSQTAILLEEDFIYNWQVIGKLHDPFDFEQPNQKRDNDPGEHVTADEGNHSVRILRREKPQANYERMQGEGYVHTLYTGGLFSLTGHPRPDQNCKYLVIATEYQLETDVFETDNDYEVYSCDFKVIRAEQVFRCARSTDNPIVHGPQTARVVGPPGEKIYTDEYGRVKVQFYWDYYGQSSENSVCWVRVSQPWAEASWGEMAMPQVNQEVIVSFEEGDPNRPIITGRVCTDQFSEIASPPADVIFIKDYWKRKKEKTT